MEDFSKTEIQVETCRQEIESTIACLSNADMFDTSLFKDLLDARDSLIEFVHKQKSNGTYLA